MALAWALPAPPRPAVGSAAAASGGPLRGRPRPRRPRCRPSAVRLPASVRHPDHPPLLFASAAPPPPAGDEDDAGASSGAPAPDPSAAAEAGGGTGGGSSGGGGGGTADEGTSLTVEDALSEWARARSRGETPADPTAAAGGRRGGGGGGSGRPFTILFVDTYNTCTSVAAEAVLGDLLTRRSIAPSAIACFSAGTRAVMGAPPSALVAEGLHFRRRLRVGDHAAVRFSADDVGSYDLIVVADEATRTEVVSLAAGADGLHDERVEAKVLLLADFCGEARLRGKGLGGRDPNRPEVVRFLLSTVVDACVGLLAHVLEKTGRS